MARDPINQNPFSHMTNENPMRGFGTLVFLGIALLFGFIFLNSMFYIVGPTERGLKITLGKMEEQFIPSGLGFKAPFITEVKKISIQQQTRGGLLECFSSDLQQVTAEVKVLYRVPESSVVKIYRDFAGDPFETLIMPRLAEALKEVTAQNTAAGIAKNREEVKRKALTLTREKIGPLLMIEDVSLVNINLSKELEHAIEQKMVQEQAAEKARFEKQKAEIEAQTVVIRAQAEAQSIKIQGEALEKSPALVQLKFVEKWNGVMPTYVSGSNAGPIPMMPMGK